LGVTRLGDDEVDIAVGVVDKGGRGVVKEWLSQNDIDDGGLDHIKLHQKAEVIDSKRDVGSQAQYNKIWARQGGDVQGFGSVDGQRATVSRRRGDKTHGQARVD